MLVTSGVGVPGIREWQKIFDKRLPHRMLKFLVKVLEYVNKLQRDK